MSLRASLVGLCVVLAGAEVGMATDAARERMGPAPQVDSQQWIAEYAQAYKQATDEQKMLCIYFDDSQPAHGKDEFLSELPKQAAELTPGRYVFAHLPLSTKASAKDNTTLASHAAFDELRGGPGVAIIDLKNTQTRHHGYVVTCLRFPQGAAMDSRTRQVVLTLPDGTLTQRTLVYAVRMHPEAPLSTHGQVNSILMEEAESHSGYQANIGVQGHQDWDSRFQRISARMRGDSPQEVCAESWPNYSLTEACFDCVNSWRQSSGHWAAVSSPSTYYGYDIKRGRNGIWYATGIFSRRR